MLWSMAHIGPHVSFHSDDYVRIPPGSNEATMRMIETVNAPGLGAERDVHKQTQVLPILSAPTKIEAWASPALPMNGRHVSTFEIR